MSPRTALLLVLCPLLLGSSGALSSSRLYPYGEPWADQRLPAADEEASPEFSLSTPFIYYGATYQSLFVNMNGFVSFLTEIPSFFNIQFPLDYPIIAALYSDVDTSSAGTVWYRETTDPATLSRLQSELGAYFAEAAEFTPSSVFVATWDGVAGFNLRPNKVNTFQIILASDGHESYVVILYADRGLQWLKGQGKNPSLPDALAQAGFISGDGRMKLLRGSGKDQVRNLDEWSNIGEPGVWVYRVGQIPQTGNIPEPELVAERPEDESCSVGGLVCHSTASCVDYAPGFCCKCPDLTFGNGINCVKDDEPLRVTGKVKGDLNGVVLAEADLHSYVLTGEGRTYTAVSRVPKSQGYDMQTLVAIGTGITWLFAKPSGGVPNGFSLTGGNMNVTVTIDFPQTGHNAFVQQTFLGLDVFENEEVNTYISGTLPNIPVGSKIEVLPFMEEYTRVKQGQLRARSNRVFRLKGQELETPFQVETTIDFDECDWVPPQDSPSTLRLKVAENIFIQYDEPEKIVRFALSSSIGPLSEEDPCIQGREQCGANSECVVDGDTYRCICNRGYEQVFDPAADSAVCADKDECATGRHQCAEHALCTNIAGSFTCACSPGYEGDGYRCQPEVSCDNAGCDPSAACRVEGGQPRCFCPPHLTGDGFYCASAYVDEALSNEVASSQPCGADVCGIHSECKFSDQENRVKCVCREGYSGDGLTCTLSANAVSCNIEENCSPYGTCQEHPQGVYTCVCLSGFAGDGYTCFLDTGFSRVDTNYPSENIVPVPIDSIPDFVLGGDYSHLPVEFGDNPYGEALPPYSIHTGDDYSLGGNEPQDPHAGGESAVHYQPVQPDHSDNVVPYDTSSGTHAGVNFDDESLRPAFSVNVPDVPAPYVPPQVPQEPLQPYNAQREDDSSMDVEPQCSLGTCFCPSGYKFNKFVGRCRLQEGYQQRVTTASPGAPRPYCGAAKCTCPQGYTYAEEADECRQEDMPAAPSSKPQPDCSGGRFPCLCPHGYYFQYPENTCEPRAAEDYDVGPIGGGDEYGPLYYPGSDSLSGHDIGSILGLPPYSGYPLGGAVDVEGKPVPQCVGDTLPCICPPGFYFQFPQRTCEPSGDSRYNYGIKGGGEPNHPYPGAIPGAPYPGAHPGAPYPGANSGAPYPGANPGAPYPGANPGAPYPGANPGAPYPGANSGAPYPGAHPGVSYPGANPGAPYPEAHPGAPYPGFSGQMPDSGMSGSHYSVSGGQPDVPYTNFGSHYPDSPPPGMGDLIRPPTEGERQPQSPFPGNDVPYHFSCNLQNVCHEYAACIYESEIDIHLCRCNPGFVGDGFTCIRQDFSCDQVNICHVNAQCIHDDLEMRSVCVCLTGYVGDGLVCTPEDECNNVDDCDINAQCGFDGLTQRYRCQCNQGYTGDGRNCVPAPDAGCNVVRNCHHHADCVFDAVALTHRCQCHSGYEGDGVICNEIQLNCKVLQNCGQHARCTELAANDYRCVCQQGFTGDGYYCQASYSCQQDPSMCHQQAVCLPDSASSLGYSCQCQRGYIGDGFTCVDAPTFESNLLLLNQGMSVLRMPVDVLSSGGGYPITVDPFMSAVGADVDCYAGRYYWTDVRSNTIRSINYDGTERRPFITKGIIGSPEDVAVDWISRNVYWTDSGNDEVAASSIDGGLRRTIITGDLVNPRGIAVHPGRGLLFWSDWNRLAPKIESSGLDGSDRRVLVDTNLRLPNSLVVDYQTSTLCWADAGTNKIECIGVNGHDRRTVIKGPQYPFGLTLHLQDFYYTDWADGRIHVVNKYTGTEEPSRPAPPGGSGRLYGIVAVPDSCPPVSNACQRENGRCPPDMLCLPNNSGGRTCACPANPVAQGNQYQGCTDIVN